MLPIVAVTAAVLLALVLAGGGGGGRDNAAAPPASSANPGDGVASRRGAPTIRPPGWSTRSPLAPAATVGRRTSGPDDVRRGRRPRSGSGPAGRT